MGTGRGLGAVTASVLALLLLLVITAVEDDDTGPGVSGVDVDEIPELARAMLPVITEVLARHCPELPPVWVVAEIQAESSWDPKAHSGDRNGGASGLYQINASNWAAAGGRPGSGDIWQPETHLRRGIPWVCTNLRAVTEHLEDTGKPTSPLDAMLVCHIAGCGRVTGSATGVPRAGEAGCGARCARLVARYLAAVHRYVRRYEMAPAEPNSQDDSHAAAVPAGLPAAPVAFAGPATGCSLDDPTSGGCLTATTGHGLRQLTAAFGGLRRGPAILSAGCWDAHAWNPRSDHSRGRACDLFPTPAGTFAEGQRLRRGWQMANWLRTHAGPLRVKYLIWQGRYWDPSTADSGGWGERYTGGGVYDVRDATGGHYDHVHVSFLD